MSLTQQSIDRALAQISFVDREINWDYLMGQTLKLNNCTRDEFNYMVTEHQSKCNKNGMKLIVTINGDRIVFEHYQPEIYAYLELMNKMNESKKPEFDYFLKMVDIVVRTVIQ